MKKLILSFFLGILVCFLAFQIYPLLLRYQLSSQLEELLSAEGRPGKVLAILPNGSLFQAIVQHPDGMAVYWLTQDGRLVQNPVSMPQLTRWLESRNHFLSCLQELNISFYGSTQYGEEARNATLLQIELLGGWEGLEGIYRSCDQNLSLCLDLGIEKVPFWVLPDRNLTGVLTLQELSNLTGCEI